MNCCICLNEEKSIAYQCSACQSGIICSKCIIPYDPHQSIFLRNLSKVIQTIQCPCCRGHNWKYHFGQIMKVSLESDCDNKVDIWNADEIKPALKYYYMQRHGKSIDDDDEDYELLRFAYRSDDEFI